MRLTNAHNGSNEFDIIFVNRVGYIRGLIVIEKIADKRRKRSPSSLKYDENENGSKDG